MGERWDFNYSLPTEPREEVIEVSLKQAEQVLLTKLARAGHDPTDALWELARFYSHSKQHEKAIEYLRRVMERIPDVESKAGCVLAMGQTMEQVRDYEAAIRYYREALSLEPTCNGTWYFINNNLGFSLNTQGKFQEGEIYCRKALQIEPRRSNAHKNLGIALQGQGKYREAVRCFISATRANASDPRSFHLLATLLDEHPELKPEFEEEARLCGEAVKIAFVETQKRKPVVHKGLKKYWFLLRMKCQALWQGIRPQRKSGAAPKMFGITLLGWLLMLTWPAQAADESPAGPDTGAANGSLAPLEFTGVNLAGGEFGPKKPGSPRTYGVQYIYPSAAEMDYFAGKGVNIIRFPFRWEDLQPVLRQPLHPAALGRVKKAVSDATARDLVIILDPHDYARYGGKAIGSPEVPHEAFADFWSRLAAQFKDNPRAWFGLMNEPHDLPNEQWLAAANAAIAAIRQAGATNRLLVPGNAWTGAHSWLSSKNAEVMLKIVDPLNNYLIEVHQYLDKDSSGTSPAAVSPTIGSERLQKFTAWCRTHGRRALLGEFGAANNETALRAVDDMLGFMEQNRDIWVGFTWWAAGPWWGDYMFTLEPKNGQDRPQMKVLRPHLQRPRSNP